MKAFFGKLLFVLAIVGIIAGVNLLWPNPDNNVRTTAVAAESEQSATADEEPAPEHSEPAEEPYEETAE